MSLATPQGPVVQGRSATFTATIAHQNLIDAPPSGAVEFLDETTDTELGTATPVNGIATLNTVIELDPGLHAIVALFAGDTSYLPSISVAASNLTVQSATEVTVTTDNLDDQGVNLREAITYADAHASNSTVTFQPSLAGQTISLKSALPAVGSSAGFAVTISGLGASVLTVKGDGTDPVFTVSAGMIATVSGLTITGGGGASGGGISNAGTLTLDLDSITGNTATLTGGGIWNSGEPVCRGQHDQQQPCGLGGGDREHGGHGRREQHDLE